MKTVLTVDDSRTMRDMLRISLETAGFRVLQAEDGLQGMAILQNNHPQVVITDLNMPNMDGFEFIRMIRSDRQYRVIPILVLTTESDPRKKLIAKEAGATGWILKPFEQASLLAAIHRVTF